LAFLAAILAVGNPVSVFLHISYDERQVPASVASIASMLFIFGLTSCLLSVIAYLSHHEDESHLLKINTSFLQMGKMWHRIQPTIYTVDPAYLFETVLAKRPTKYPVRPFAHLFTPVITRWLIIHSGIRRHIKDNNRKRKRHIRLAMLSPTRPETPRPTADRWLNDKVPPERICTASCYLCRTILVDHIGPFITTFIITAWYQFPGTRIPSMFRDVIHKKFVLWSRQRLLERFIHDTGKSYSHTLNTRSHSGATHTDYEAMAISITHPSFMAQSDTYYSQLSEGFCLHNIGITKDAKIYLPDDTYYQEAPIPLREEDSIDEGRLGIFSKYTWRVFVSEYISAQQLRTKNWNLHFRVKQSERLFRLGFILIVSGFVLFVASAVLLLWLPDDAVRPTMPAP